LHITSKEEKTEVTKFRSVPSSNATPWKNATRIRAWTRIETDRDIQRDRERENIEKQAGRWRGKKINDR
jgi:hypothetical protein